MAPFSFFDEAVALAGPDRAFLTGDWGGLRTRLLDLGIAPSLVFVTDVLGNPVGGQHRAVRESDDLGLDLTVDLDRLAGWAGARFHLSFSMRSGTNLSDKDIGNVFTVANVCCGFTYRLVNVELEQSLFDDRVSLRGGRIAAGDEFLTSPLYGNFVQEAFNGNPTGIFFNVPMTAYPTATWGMRARVRPISQLSLMAGVYNGDPTLGDNDKHGVDWTMRGPLFAIGEVGWRLNQEPGATGLPGNYKIGGYYQAGEVPDLYRDVDGGSIALSGLPPQMHNGNGGFYILLDQMVYRDGGAGQPAGPHAVRVPALCSQLEREHHAVFRQWRPGLPRALLLAPGRYGRRRRGVRRVQPPARALTARCQERGQRGGDPEVRGRARAHLYHPGEKVAAGAAGPSIHHQSRRYREDPQRARPRIPARAHPVRRAAPEPHLPETALTAAPRSVGSRTRKMAPPAGSFSPQMRPWCACTIERLMASPMPSPSCLVVKKGSKTRSRSALGDAFAGIVDAQIRVGVPGGGPHGDLAVGGRPRRGGSDGVDEQVQDDLLDLNAIPVHDR